jgi:thymidylate synthase ThyX
VSYERQVYLLNPRELSPETIAVAFAKTSRSPESFRAIAAELTDEKSSQFHEKWVVGYGHSSVAEHAVLHIAIENVSRLAVECIESNRLASYTEKSTRYQKWTPDAFFTPAEFSEPEICDLYVKSCTNLFNAYQEILPRLRRVVEQDQPRHSEETSDAWERRIRSRYVDVARYLLPAASLANLGMTANARVLESAIRKMLAHPLEEVRQIGRQVWDTSAVEVPTLLKYAEPGAYQIKSARTMLKLAALDSGKDGKSSNPGVRMVSYTKDGERQILGAILYRNGNLSYAECMSRTSSMKQTEKEGNLDDLLGGLEKHDNPPRELEFSDYLFDCMMDQGAYFEVKRHRMATQTVQPLTVEHGYRVPALLERAGVMDDYRRAMDKVRDAYHHLERVSPDAASYIVPNGYLRRILMQMNLREAFHFCGLRSAPNAHFGVRTVAQQIGELIRSVHPTIGKYLPVNPHETKAEIENDYFI